MKNHKKTMNRLNMMAVSAVALLGYGYAQAADKALINDAGLEEVVVTARQRSEKLVDVPATVQAFTATEIKSAGITRPADFINLTPGVSQVQTVEVGDLQINIRGINSGRDTESSVALVIDGVLMTNPNSLNQELDGVSQIEVLKGPQGALYGRNALAGAIILTTAKPSDNLEANVKGGIGKYGLWTASGDISGPLGPNIKGLIGAYTRHDNGSDYNSFAKCGDCENFLRETGVHGRLVIKAGENAEFDIKGRYSKVKAGGVTFNASLALKDAADAGFGNLFWEDPNQHQFTYINLVRPDNQQTNKNFSIKGTFNMDIGTLEGVVSYNDEKNYFLSDGTSNAFGIYNANAVCQASYAAANGTIPLPPPFFYAPDIGSSFLPPYPPVTCGGYQYQQRDQKDGALQLRLSSPADQRLRWMVGIYLAKIDRHLVVSYGGDLGSGVYNHGFVPSTGPNPSDLLFDDSLHSKVYAGFGNVEYDVMKNLEIALALREDIEDRSVDNNVPKVSPQTPGFGAFGVPVCPDGPANCSYYINPYYNEFPNVTSIPSRKKTFSQLQPKVSINWKVTPEWAIYASYGYGFRSGGFNSSGDAATIQRFYGGLHLADGTLNLNALSDEFKKEVSKAAELGFKATVLNNTLSLNGAVYLTRDNNMQIFDFMAGPFGSLRMVSNIDNTELKGAEFGFNWRPVRALSLFGGVGFTDSKILAYTMRPYTAGNKVPYVPSYTGNAGINFRQPLPFAGNSITFETRIDETFTGKTWFSAVQDNTLPNAFTAVGFGRGNFSKQYRAPYAVTNLHVSLSTDSWSLSAWSTNLFNKKFLAEIIPAPEFGGSFIHDSYGRTYGLTASYHFGAR